MGLLAEFEKRVSTKKLSLGMTLQGHRNSVSLKPALNTTGDLRSMGEILSCRGRVCPSKLTPGGGCILRTFSPPEILFGGSSGPVTPAIFSHRGRVEGDLFPSRSCRRRSFSWDSGTLSSETGFCKPFFF